MGLIDNLNLDIKDIKSQLAIDITLLSEIEASIDKYMPNWNYQIPELDNSNVKYMLCISGGVDSAALACVMLTKHREPEFRNKLHIKPIR